MREREEIAYTVARFRNVRCDELMARSCGRELTAALIFTPDDCLVARVVGSTFNVVRGGRETPADVSRAYEIRVFGPDAELRWVREGVGGGATLLADNDVAESEGAEFALGRTLDVLPRRYCVWGEPPKQRGDEASIAANVPSGWAALSAGRIGTIHVPLPAGTVLRENEEVELLAREYVVRGASGNAVVLFERLVGFEVAVGGKQ